MKHVWPSVKQGRSGLHRGDGASEACEKCGLVRRFTLRTGVFGYDYVVNGAWVVGQNPPGCPDPEWITKVKRSPDPGGCLALIRQGDNKGRVCGRPRKSDWACGRHSHLPRPEGTKESMTSEQVMEAVKKYKIRVAREVGPVEWPLGVSLKETESGKYTYPTIRLNALAHVSAMLTKMEGFVESGKMEKAFRWLGFVQGVLWVCGVYSIDDMKDDNR
jgi:hypothetical protein